MYGVRLYNICIKFGRGLHHRWHWKQQRCSAGDDPWQKAMAAIVAVTAIASPGPAAEAVAADAAAEGGSSDRRDRRCMPPPRRPRWRQKTRCYRVLSDKGRPITRKTTEAEITRGYRPIPAVRYMRFAFCILAIQYMQSSLPFVLFIYIIFHLLCE